jgi:hypothetical protein
VLRFDRDRTGRVPLEDRRHRVAQLAERRNDDAGLLLDLLHFHVAAREVRPGKVVEEEVRPGLIRVARPAEIVDLHVIEIGHLAQQAEPLARLPKLLQLPLRSLEALGRERVETVDLAGDQPNRFTVACVLRCLPGVADPREARLQVAGGRVEESLDRLLRGAGNLQITRHVVQEQILEDVGTVVAPSRLAVLPRLLDELRVVARPLILGKQVLVGVDKRE